MIGLVSIFVVVPVHDRRKTTLAMLESFKRVVKPKSVGVTVCVIDDGSIDGTEEAIRLLYPEIVLHRGDGSLFWSGAVRLGIDLFLASDATHLWLLNDDLRVDPQCLERLLAVVAAADPWVVSGTVEDSLGEPIYGGIIRKRFFRFRRATESDYVDGICRSHSANGNCLLISRVALESFDLPPHGLYRQEGMDMYIGLEATRLGHVPIVVREARCFGDSNKSKLSFYRREKPLTDRMRAILGPKGLPPRMYWDFCRRFSGPLAPLLFLRPYLHVFLARRVETSANR